MLRNNLFISSIIWSISKTRFLIKAITTIFASLIPAINILIIRYVISVMESNDANKKEIFLQVMLVLFVYVLIQIVMRIFEIWNSAYIDPVIVYKINNHMNNVFISKAKEFEYSCFEDPIFFDKYVRALNQVDTVTHSVFNAFFGLFAGIISVVSLISIIFLMDWSVLLFVIFNVIVKFIQSVIFAKLNFDKNQSLTPLSRKQSYIKRLLYIPDYAKEVKYYDIISTGKKYYEQALNDIISVIKKFGVKIAILNTAINIISVFSSGGLMVFLISNVLFGAYKIADFSALSSSSTQLETALNSIFQTLSTFYQNSLEIENLKFVYNYENRSHFIGDEILDITEPFKIAIEQLSFKYPNANEFVLKDISFTIERGEKVSIVGLNGSGKTTLIKLLLGLYPPTSGKIYINDKDINSYPKKELQKKIGVAFQDTHVYAYSVKENIAFEGKINDDVVLILKRMDIYNKIISLPEGFETVLSKEFDNNGINISGGEIQKICIARALNIKSGLYIFDEPSSSLDPVSEYEINKIITELKSNTVILVSHRLSTTVMSDNILMFQKGRLIEQGNHNNLMQLNGEYARLFKIQSSKYITNHMI